MNKQLVLIVAIIAVSTFLGALIDAGYARAIPIPTFVYNFAEKWLAPAIESYTLAHRRSTLVP